MTHQSLIILPVLIYGWTTLIYSLTIDCDHQLCPKWCKCYFLHINQTNINIRMDCSSANITSISSNWQIPFCHISSKEDVIRNLSVLLSINLSHNRIIAVSPLTTLRYLNNVETLDFSYNLINNLSDFPLQSMTSLRVLIVHNNRLTHIPRMFEKYIPDLIPLNQISFYDNPWSCDCGNNWIPKWLKQIQSKITDVQRMRCNWPKAVKGQPLINISGSYWLCDSDIHEHYPLSKYRSLIIAIIMLYLILCSAVAMLFICRKRQQVKPAERYVVYQTS